MNSLRTRVRYIESWVLPCLSNFVIDNDAWTVLFLNVWEDKCMNCSGWLNFGMQSFKQYVRTDQGLHWGCKEYELCPVTQSLKLELEFVFSIWLIWSILYRSVFVRNDVRQGKTWCVLIDYLSISVFMYDKCSIIMYRMHLCIIHVACRVPIITNLIEIVLLIIANNICIFLVIFRVSSVAVSYEKWGVSYITIIRRNFICNNHAVIAVNDDW